MKKKIILCLGLSLLALSACGGTGGTSASASSLSSAQSSAESSSSSEEASSSTPYVSLSTSLVSKDLSYSGYLIDAAVGFPVPLGNTEKLTFEFDEASNENPTVTSSRPESIEVTYDENTKVFALVGKAVGDSIIIIKDKDGIIHYRNVIHCHAKIAQKDVDEYLIATDHFQSWQIAGMDLKLYFYEAGTGNLSGSDEGTAIGTIEFSYAYNAELSDDEWYYFSISGFKNTKSQLIATEFAMTVTGDFVHLYGADGIYAVFQPAKK